MIAYLFNCENETLNQCLLRYVPVSKGLEAETVIPPLESAFDLFIRPLLGDDGVSALLAAAELHEWGDEVPDPVQTKWVRWALRAVSNLAFWYHYTELSVQITDQGFQRMETETFKPLYKYQEDALRRSFKNKGFNALDEFLSLMEQHHKLVGNESVYAALPVVRDRADLLAHTRKEVDRYVFINGSYLTFLRLVPHLRSAELTDLEPVIGRELYLRLKSNPADEQLQQLREHCVPVLSVAAAVALVETTGSLTDRGLYYASLQSTTSSTTQAEPVPEAERAMMLDRLQVTLRTYKDALSRYIREELSDDFPGSPAEAFRRDNTDKHTFWA